MCGTASVAKSGGEAELPRFSRHWGRPDTEDRSPRATAQCHESAFARGLPRVILPIDAALLSRARSIVHYVPVRQRSESGRIVEPKAVVVARNGLPQCVLLDDQAR